MNFTDIVRLAAHGESETVELKASTGQLTRAGKALCGFLNRQGGQVIFGVGPGGQITGQIVADKTLQEIGALLRSFEPQPPISFERIAIPNAAVGVRFLASGYIAPLRVSHDLRFRQREILHLLAGKGPTPLRVIRAGLESVPSDRTIQMELAHLKRLRLTDSGAVGGARSTGCGATPSSLRYSLRYSLTTAAAPAPSRTPAPWRSASPSFPGAGGGGPGSLPGPAAPRSRRGSPPPAGCAR
jgi:hypothetical protein